MNKTTKQSPVPFTRLFHILIVFFALVGTQFMLPINLLGRTIFLYYVEPLLIALFLGTLVYMLVKRQKPVFTTLEWLLPSLFVLWFFVLTAYRFLAFGDLTGGFINFRVLTFPILLVLILKQLKAEKKDVFYGILLFATGMNLYQVISIFIARSFRTVLALKNINIYLCFMLALLPLLLMMLKNFRHKSGAVETFMKAVLVFNIISILVFSFFSGSRLTIVIIPVTFVVAFFLVFGFSGKTFLRLFTLLLIFIVIASTVLTLDVYDSRYNVSRTYAEVFSLLKIEMPVKAPSADPGQTDTDETDKKDPVKEDPLGAETNVADSNSMRDLIWAKSIEYIKASPFWGRTTIDVEFEMNFAGLDEPVKMVQSPHNFILESWMALGLPGLLLYSVIVLAVTLAILLKKIKLSDKILLFTVLFAVFGFSFFQPLVTCYFAVSLILWFAFFLFYEKDKSPSAECEKNL